MDRLLSVEEVAEALGLSRFTVYSWSSKRRLPSIKVGSRLMFRASEVQRWIDLCPRPDGEQGLREAEQVLP
jgi:excisionase family DNA binding protein